MTVGLRVPEEQEREGLWTSTAMAKTPITPDKKPFSPDREKPLPVREAFLCVAVAHHPFLNR